MSIPTITATRGMEGSLVEWNGRMEWELGKEHEVMVAQAVRRRDSGENRSFSATDLKPLETYRFAVSMLCSSESYDPEGHSSKYRRITADTGTTDAGGMVVFWDIETSNKIDDQVGRFREDKIRALSVSCACTLAVKSELILQGKEEEALASAIEKTYWIDDEMGLEPMLKQFDSAELLVSYNGSQFDHLVMAQYYKGNRERELSHTFKSHDIFRRVVDVQARKWPKLDRLLTLNGFGAKTGNGLMAITWFAQGNREALENYCKTDVSLMAKLTLKRDGIILDGESVKAPFSVIGVAPALAARRFCFPEGF